MEVRKFGTMARVSAGDLADAEADRESRRRWGAMTPEERAAHKARRDAELAASLLKALTDWQSVRERLAGNPQALAALGIHKPVTTAGWVACEHCQEGSDGDPVEWPCETYTAVKEA